MYVIADGLARMLAPILPVTTEEMWKHLPGKREASVHLAEFPPLADVEALLDVALVRRWERLIEIRNEVNRSLEAARQAKAIGNSLGARVVLRARGEAATLLQSVRDDLPMLFIVSQLEFESGGGDGPELEVAVTRAEGDKCARCWRIVPSVSDAAGTAGLCDRCVSALEGTHATR
jgi:isoleucyl-tRNA synthetase